MAGESERPDVAQAKARMHTKLGAKRALVALPAHLREHETVERIATWIGSGVTTGLIVATDQRLLTLRSKRAGDIVDELPYDQVSSIQWVAGKVHGTMTVLASGTSTEFTNVDSSDGEAVVAAARSRASGKPIPPPPSPVRDSAPAVKPQPPRPNWKPKAEFEYKSIKVPRTGTVFTNRKRDRILNKYAREGWEVDQYATPGIFGRTDTVVLRRKAQ
jgi:hypothetical protein